MKHSRRACGVKRDPEMVTAAAEIDTLDYMYVVLLVGLDHCGNMGTSGSR